MAEMRELVRESAEGEAWRDEPRAAGPAGRIPQRRACAPPRAARARATRRAEAYSPFPVEGLAEALGMRPARHRAGGPDRRAAGRRGRLLPAVVCGGGRLSRSTSAAGRCTAGRFMPATFELAILGAACAAVLAMLVRTACRGCATRCSRSRNSSWPAATASSCACPATTRCSTRRAPRARCSRAAADAAARGAGMSGSSRAAVGLPHRAAAGRLRTRQAGHVRPAALRHRRAEPAVRRRRGRAHAAGRHAGARARRRRQFERARARGRPRTHAAEAQQRQPASGRQAPAARPASAT
jgi:hypothetical protein